MSSFVELLNEGMGESVEYDITEDTIPNKQIYGTFKLNGETYGMSFVKTTTNRHFTFEFWRLATKNKRMWDIRKGSDWNVIVPTLMRFLEMCYTMSKPVCDSIIIRIPVIPKIEARQKFLERIIRKSFIKTMNYVPVRRLSEQKFTHLYLVKKGVDPKSIFNGAVFKKHFDFDLKDTEQSELINDETLEVMSEPYRRQKPFPSLRPTKLAFGTFALDTDSADADSLGKEIDAVVSVLTDPAKVRKVNQTEILNQHDGKTSYVKVKPEDVVPVADKNVGLKPINDTLFNGPITSKYAVLKTIVAYATLVASGRGGHDMTTMADIQKLFKVNLKTTASRDLPYAITQAIVNGRWFASSTVMKHNFIGLGVDWAHLSGLDHEPHLQHLFNTTNIAEFLAVIKKAVDKYTPIVDWNKIRDKQDTDLATGGKFSATILSELGFNGLILGLNEKTPDGVLLRLNDLVHVMIEPYLKEIFARDTILYYYWVSKLNEMSDFTHNLNPSSHFTKLAGVMKEILNQFYHTHITENSTEDDIINFAIRIGGYEPVGFKFKQVEFITGTMNPKLDIKDSDVGNTVESNSVDPQQTIKGIIERAKSQPSDIDALGRGVTISQAIFLSIAIPVLGQEPLTGPLHGSSAVTRIKKIHDSNWRKHKVYAVYKLISAMFTAKVISDIVGVIASDDPYRVFSSLLETKDSPDGLTWEDINQYTKDNLYHYGHMDNDDSVIDGMDKLHATSEESFLMQLSVGVFALSGASFSQVKQQEIFDYGKFTDNLHHADTYIGSYMSDIFHKTNIAHKLLEQFITNSYSASKYVGKWVKNIVEQNPEISGEDVVTTMTALGVRVNRLLFAKEAGSNADPILANQASSKTSKPSTPSGKNTVIKSERLELDFELSVPSDSPFSGDNNSSAGFGELGFNPAEMVSVNKKMEYLKSFDGVTDALNSISGNRMYQYTGSGHKAINNSAREAVRFNLDKAISNKEPISVKGEELARFIKDFEKIAISIEVPFWVFRNTSIPKVDEYQVGDDLIDPAFLSTTIDPAMSYGMGTSRMKIFVPAGTRFVPAFGVGQNGTEYEVILPPLSVNRIVEKSEVERGWSNYCFVCLYSGSAHRTVFDYGQQKEAVVVESLADLKALIEAKAKKPVDDKLFGDAPYNPNEKWGGELFDKSKDIAKLIKVLKDKKNR